MSNKKDKKLKKELDETNAILNTILDVLALDGKELKYHKIITDSLDEPLETRRNYITHRLDKYYADEKKYLKYLDETADLIQEQVRTVKEDPTQEDYVKVIQRFIEEQFCYEKTDDTMYSFVRDKKGQCAHFAVLFRDLCKKMGVKVIQRFIEEQFCYEKTDDTMYSFVRDKKGQCAHFAVLFRDLCKKMGIKAWVLKGPSEGANHAWNKVRIDNEDYYFDLTYNITGAEEVNGYYAWRTYEEMLKDHQVQIVLEGIESIDNEDYYFDLTYNITGAEEVNGYYAWRTYEEMLKDHQVQIVLEGIEMGM